MFGPLARTLVRAHAVRCFKATHRAGARGRVRARAPRAPGTAPAHLERLAKHGGVHRGRAARRGRVRLRRRARRRARLCLFLAVIHDRRVPARRALRLELARGGARRGARRGRRLGAPAHRRPRGARRRRARHAQSLLQALLQRDHRVAARVLACGTAGGHWRRAVSLQCYGVRAQVWPCRAAPLLVPPITARVLPGRHMWQGPRRCAPACTACLHGLRPNTHASGRCCRRRAPGIVRYACSISSAASAAMRSCSPAGAAGPAGATGRLGAPALAAHASMLRHCAATAADPASTACALRPCLLDEHRLGRARAERTSDAHAWPGAAAAPASGPAAHAAALRRPRSGCQRAPCSMPRGQPSTAPRPGRRFQRRAARARARGLPGAL